MAVQSGPSLEILFYRAHEAGTAACLCQGGEVWKNGLRIDGKSGLLRADLEGFFAAIEDVCFFNRKNPLLWSKATRRVYGQRKEQKKHLLALSFSAF